MKIMQYALDNYIDIKANQYLGIFGDPIKHTLSPLLHDTLSDELGKNIKYIPFHITDNLGQAVKMAYEEGILGLNITVPHKQEVMEYLVEVDDAARVIGAVNTLVRVEGGYKGYNTDMPGLAKALMNEKVELKGANIIMLGAGGAARAVAYMCLNYGANKVYIVNRTYENAKKIADDMNNAFDCEKIQVVAAVDYKVIPQDKYIMIQCTSIGLHEGDGLPLVEDDTFYDMADVGIDLIYNPAKTPFLSVVESKGAKAINGLGMLLNQGIIAYEYWNNVKISNELSDKVYRRLCSKVYEENLVLIGYMGAGKTAVGKALAESLGYDFLDTDEYIVELEGMSINDIFTTKGEEYFRDLETKVVMTLSSTLKSTVVSTGGGLPMREENRSLLKKLGKVIYLMASADTTYKRVSSNGDRPLLVGDNMYDKICAMLTVRIPKYMEGADLVIETDQLNIQEIVEKINQ